MEVKYSRETSVLITAIRCNILEDGILQSCNSLDFYFLFICGAGLERSPLLLRPLTGLFYQPSMIDDDDDDDDDFESINGINKWQGKLQYSEETRCGAALSTKGRT
jgi:hypothetical protein